MKFSGGFLKCGMNQTLMLFGKQPRLIIKLYKSTAKAIKKVNKNLKVGGPATASNAWIPEFKNYCDKNKVPMDFISTHHYPTDSFGKPGDDTITQLSKSKRSALQAEAKKAKQQAGNLPLYYTEWCTSSNPFDDLHDESYAACFIIKTVLEANGIVDGYSYWTFSDILKKIIFFPSFSWRFWPYEYLRNTKTCFSCL